LRHEDTERFKKEAAISSDGKEEVKMEKKFKKKKKRIDVPIAGSDVQFKDNMKAISFDTHENAIKDFKGKVTPKPT
jgi:hypothetical protein